MKYKLLLLFFINVFSVGVIGKTCEMGRNTHKSDITFHVIDSCMVDVLGKENASFILEADSVIATTIPWEGCKEESVKLSECMSAIVKYTFCTPSMYLSNKKVYASFQPYSKLDFHYKGQILTVQFDYGINKWMIAINDKIICYDLKNSALLPLFFILFKTNPLIQQSYKKISQ